MSNFNCDKCGTTIIDSSNGYITSCEHYKAENVNKFRSDIRLEDVLGNLRDSQVDIPNEFRAVLNELFSNSVDVNKQENVSDIIEEER